MTFDIKKFDQYRENNRLEVKRAQGGLPNSLWETYSSMANCYGGVILLGVIEKEDGSFETTGLRDVENLRREFWNLINNCQKVSINLLTEKDVEAYEIGNDVILAIYVPRARREDKPVFINGDLFNGTYRRDADGDYHCTKAEIKSMLRDQTEETMDMKILENMEISDLNMETVHAYRNRHTAYRREHVWESLKDEEYLERIGAAKRTKPNGKLHPTAAGLLMFGEEYKILYEYPEYFLDYREMLDPTIRWTDRLQSSSGDWSGNVFDFFFRVATKLTKDLKIPFKLEGITRIDDTPVHKALREALANCLVNTDFFVPRGVVIKKEIDKIIIENPGYIRTGKDQMLKGGISDPRNKALMKMFNMLGIGERAGSGVPDIYRTWKLQGWQAPHVEEKYNPDRTILTLSFNLKNKDSKEGINDGINDGINEGRNEERNEVLSDVLNSHSVSNTAKNKVESKFENEVLNEVLNNVIKTNLNSVSENKRKKALLILKELAQNEKSTISNIENKTGIKKSTVDRYLSALKDIGLIRREGSKKSGSWKILIKSTDFKK